MTFDDLALFAEWSALPVVVKGVLRGDDAERCVDAGAAAIAVSNHGGRTMDGIVATADALAEVVDAVGDRAEVYVDGGIRHGADVVKALAMGARAVLIGRPVLWGLSVAGDDGVAHVLSTLEQPVRGRDGVLRRPTRRGAHPRSGLRGGVANLGACAETSPNSAASNLRRLMRRSKPPPGNSSGRSPA